MIEVDSVAEQRVRRVCVAIPTYRRPVLLDSLLGHIRFVLTPPPCEIEVVVIDNDNEPSARHIVEAARGSFPCALSYLHVAEPGLSSVRNASLAFASSGFEFLAMIDDDECPQPQWISELLRVADETGADSVIGPVPTALPLDAPKWLRAGRFYDLPTYRDCAAIKFGYSGNCLLRMSSIKRLGMSFDLELNFAGGEDMLFFRQLVERGGKLRYAAHATAYERLEPERLTAPYILRLYFRRGNTLTLCDRRLNHRVMALAARALKGGARVFVGLGMLVPMVCVRGRAGALRALCDIVHGLGSLSGLAGHIYQGYRRVDAPRK